MQRPSIPLYLTLLILSIATPTLAQQETPVESRIDSVGLFKNGLAVVRRSLTVAGPGVYRLDDVPAPVHGTFWIESSAPSIEARVTTREVEAPMYNKGLIAPQDNLAGRQVTLRFRESTTPPITGKVVVLEPAKGDNQAWNRLYQRPYDPYYHGGTILGPTPRFLVLQTSDGRAYVDTSTIGCLTVHDPAETIRQRLPVLLLTVGGDPQKPQPATVTISYLAQGIAWAPSYRITLLDKQKLLLEQEAIIRNELADLRDADISLISGFPSIQFAHVTSPLAPASNWAQFFTQLSQRIGTGNMSNVMAQQAIASNQMTPDQAGIDLSATPAGDGTDLHYQPIGKRTLDEGDSLALSVAKGEAQYERIVEWLVPDTRDADGRYPQPYQTYPPYQQNPEPAQDTPWDAIRFKNPLPFPMTTAPAMVLDNGRFAGQRTTFFVNTGERTTLQITKALSVRTRASEHEEADPARGITMIGHRQFRQVTVTGQLSAANHRAEEITLVIRRQFSGDLLEADADPKLTLREEGVYSVNRRNELLWTLPLKPGEQRTLTYRYTTLVAN